MSRDLKQTTLVCCLLASGLLATITGTDQSETLNGTENNDSISSGNGDDTVYGAMVMIG
jgi:hypothetical protein|tara:strand:+ start:328 stop:504 length:177 start_codon:yes stop_codon:yes gene_type:complete